MPVDQALVRFFEASPSGVIRWGRSRVSVSFPITQQTKVAKTYTDPVFALFSRRKNRADSAWFCVDAATLRAVARYNKKSLTSGPPHGRWVSLAVMQDEIPDPVNIRKH